MTDLPGAGEVHLWLLFDHGLSDRRLLRRSYRQLSTDERLRCGAARDPLRYLLSRALVRTTLSRYLPVAPQQWVFSANAYGKPGIANPIGRDLTFNLSHTEGLLALGVSGSGELGVDVEQVVRRPAPLRIARHFFSQEEAAVLHRLPPERRSAYFFQCWTLKEAYIKARGLGLFLPLTRFGFEFAGQTPPRMHIQPGMDDTPARWRFWQYQLRPGYQLAVCAQMTPTYRVTMRQLAVRGGELVETVVPVAHACEQ